jgi:hypothetical protein
MRLLKSGKPPPASVERRAQKGGEARAKERLPTRLVCGGTLGMRRWLRVLHRE